MKLLILGDSHCRDMDQYIKAINSSISVLVISAGDQLPTIRFRYRLQLAQIRSFNPDFVILHAGHNDMTYHQIFNHIPCISRDVTRELTSFATEIKRNFQLANIILSSILPRMDSPHSSLTPENTVKYNNLAVRHGLRLRSAAQRLGFPTNLDMFMWARVYKTEVNTKYLLPDGLHLNELGQKELAASWVSSVLSIQTL
jgi:lysophospholipase L1-like esterase